MEIELMKMVIECCAQEKTFRRFYGLLAQRFAMVKPVYRDLLTHTCFPEQVLFIHPSEDDDCLTQLVRGVPPLRYEQAAERGHPLCAPPPHGRYPLVRGCYFVVL